MPNELIAQYPSHKRDDSRLFILNRKSNSYLHTKFYELDKYITENDLVICNNARVMSARVICQRETGGIVEIILTRKLTKIDWLVITNRTKRLKSGEILTPIKNSRVTFKVIRRDNNFIKIQSNSELTDSLISSIGEIPLPPYIKSDISDFGAERYQTIFANESGAVAAPTAGLHFTSELIEKLQKKGTELVTITLFVSWGTFQPVRSQNIQNHVMDTERYILEEDTAQKINQARKKGNRIIAVGTTSLRVLESTYVNGINIPGSGETDIFIYPPQRIQSVDALITNFHTPYSTLLMLVAAFAGYETIMSAYKEAVKERYRFFSFGDAMFII